MLKAEAFAVVQLRVDVPPDAMLAGEAERLQVGAGAEEQVRSVKPAKGFV